MVNPDSPIAPVPNDSSAPSYSKEPEARTKEDKVKPMAKVDPGFLDSPEDLYSCCDKTIEEHGANNPMMVCAGCKQIIKRFDDVKAFQAYIKFCRSRHRKIYATVVNPWYIVIFHSYASFGS